jgi:hypothetical protein
MSKFLLNLLLQISKALVNSKIQFLIQKFFFLILARPTLRPTRSLSLASPLVVLSPTGRKRPTGPSSPRVSRVFAGNTFSFSVYAFRAGRLSHVSLSTGPHMSVSSPTSSHPSSPAPPPIPGHRAPLSSAPWVPSSHYHLAFISPPLISLLNLSSSRPSSMALTPLTPPLTARPPLPGAPPGPYKRRAPPHSSPHLFQPLFASLHTRAFLSPRAATSPFCTVVSQPPQRRSSSGETRAEFPSLPSPFCAPAGEH